MDRAVVLGGSIGGLLAARALGDAFREVVVVERDELPGSPRPRRGVPQGRHAHGVLARGVAAFEELFPGLTEELVAAGVPRARYMGEIRFVLSGYELAHPDLNRSNIQPTRPLLEHAVRARVAGLPNVKILDGHAASGLTTQGGTVTGARIRRQAGDSSDESIAADVVVDALGRGGRAMAWLAELGYAPPREDQIRCDLTYVSRFLRIPDGALAERVVLVAPVPGRPRMMALMAQEDSQWILTVGGMSGDRPDPGDEGFLAFAETVAPADVFRVIEQAEPLTAPVSHHFPASVRRRYERLRRFPPGLLVFGDAICSFNPLYGQGMTVAALQAQVLRQCVQSGDGDLAGRFFRAAANVIDTPWQLAARGDLALPEVPGRRSPQIRLLNRYLTRLHRAAATDPRLATAFLRVSGLVDPPSALLAPKTMVRVLTHHQNRRGGS